MNKIKKSILIATILFTFVFIFSNSVFAVEPTKVLVTKTTTGGAEDSQSTNPSTSADGRYVAFESYASNIGTGSSGRGIQDIYVYDRQTNVTEWITHTPSGKAANGNSYSPSISGNGRYVAFASQATNLGPGGSGNGIKDIYVYDRTAKVMRWITHDANGKPASNHSYFPVISADGTTLAFQSTSKNLGTGGSEYYVEDIYIYDLTSNASNNYPVWITHTVDGKTANGASMNPSISENGRYIAFETTATNLGINPYIKFGTGNGVRDIFRYDKVTGLISWINKNPDLPVVKATPSGGIYSGSVTVSLYFESGGPGVINYKLGDGNYQPYTGPFTISDTTNLYFYGFSGGLKSYTYYEPYIFDNNVPIVWATPATGAYQNYVDVTLHMTENGIIYYTTDGTDPLLSNKFVSNGESIHISGTTTLRFVGLSNTYLYSDGASESYTIIPPVNAINPSISGDGSIIAYERGNNIYVFDLNTLTRVLITQTKSGGSANGKSNEPSLSGDGNTLTFETTAKNLGVDPTQPYGSNLPGVVFYDDNFRRDIFTYTGVLDVFDHGVNNANMKWVTKNPNYGPANGNSYTPSLNYDGKVLAYSSSANNLGPGGSGVYRDIFLEDSGLQVTVDKKAGSYKGPLTVRLSMINGLGDIYYTINGQDPQTSAGIKYTGPIIITADTLLRYSGKGSDGVWSLNYSQKYVIKKPPTVTVNPVGGTYTTVKTVTLTTKDPDSTATTYYTTDGSDPKTSGTRKTYKNPIQIGSTTVLRFIAVDPDGNWSPSYKQTYTINLPKNTITIAQLNSAAASVRKYYETHSKKLPSNVEINGKTYTMAQLLYLLVTVTINMNTNNLNPITPKTVNSAPSPSGTIKNGNIQKTSYISYAKSIQKYINTNGRVPNYVSTNLGKMQFKYMVYMYTKIVNYFVSNKRLPNYVAMTK
ncbi:MAG: chitobiase/beta-hexosaminidase C-terminal domain-containing protein [Methanobacterium sp.]